jgi:dTDP-4-dehydrorhamnose reductase
MIAHKVEKIRAVDYQWGFPTFTRDLSRALARLLELGRTGVFHVTNAGFYTRLDLARQIFSYRKKDVIIILISSAELGRPARRPANSVFNCLRFEQATGLKMRSWSEALQKYLAFRSIQCYKIFL